MSDPKNNQNSAPTSKNIEDRKTNDNLKDESRRNLIKNVAYATAGVGAVCAFLPFIDSMNPSKDVQALASVEVDISNIKVGEEKKVMWRGKPIFIKRRTSLEIDDAKKVELSELKDPQNDSDRVKAGKEEWLVTIGICTHLGCVPIGGQGEYKGWFCPCHGSQYDTSGRIRKGPAPKNLEIPPYEFLNDKTIKIG
ncbi:MAG: ubiquinol-cytochrome c reductase iron-sulfur subunit [Proteobacteria bacterium]|nr:ubiquinol-cytochrome c reductase iron-sulfur subunit [Pseudomonadota bacterium]NCA28082.1 ubiquinol-cytochrome c reductase iron-sulfur subunit [Pseudomonadota bacterium]